MDTATVTLCEGSSQTISCSSGSTLDVTSAMYGRQTYWHSCGTDFTYCSASGALSTTESACDGRSSCTISASNGVYGDPCGGVGKYLTVSYSCTSKSNYVNYFFSWVTNSINSNGIKNQCSFYSATILGVGMTSERNWLIPESPKYSVLCTKTDCRQTRCLSLTSMQNM